MNIAPLIKKFEELEKDFDKEFSLLTILKVMIKVIYFSQEEVREGAAFIAESSHDNFCDFGCKCDEVARKIREMNIW